MLRWDRYGFDKKHDETRYAELLFLHPMGATGHVVHSGVSGEPNIDARFFMLGWDPYGLDKKCARTSYAELLFLHPVGSAGDLVHSGASEVRNGDALFFIVGWEWYRFDKKALGHVTSNLCFCIWWDLWAT
jgi:hypothetical protein